LDKLVAVVVGGGIEVKGQIFVDCVSDFIFFFGISQYWLYLPRQCNSCYICLWPIACMQSAFHYQALCHTI